MKIYIYISLFFLLFSSCDNEIAFNNYSSFLGTWELKTVLIGGDGVSTPPSQITINFSEQEKELVFNGSSTCNFYGGDVIKISANNISLSAMFTTEIACSPDLLNNYENEYYNWLGKATNYSIEENTLILFFDNTFLNFEKLN